MRANSAHAHAHVLALHHHDGAGRIEVLDKRVGDLIGEPLLQLGAARKDFNSPRKFRETNNPPISRDICHMCLPMERQQVMLARREEVDVGDRDEFVRALLERSCEVRRNILAEPPEKLRVGLRHTFWCLDDAFAIWILADGNEDLTNRTRDARLIDFARERTRVDLRRRVRTTATTTITVDIIFALVPEVMRV